MRGIRRRLAKLETRAMAQEEYIPYLSFKTQEEYEAFLEKEAEEAKRARKRKKRKKKAPFRGKVYIGFSPDDWD